MRFMIAWTISVALSCFWVYSFATMRVSKYEDSTLEYKIWWDYCYVYGCVTLCAITAYGVSYVIGA